MYICRLLIVYNCISVYLYIYIYVYLQTIFTIACISVVNVHKIMLFWWQFEYFKTPSISLLLNINIYISFCIVYTCKVLGLLIIEYYNDYIDAITCLYYGIYCLKWHVQLHNIFMELLMHFIISPTLIFAIKVFISISIINN